MADIPESLDFPGEELKVLELWNSIDAFKTSLKMSKAKPRYTFYDGPPFATGLPHYGHILAGTIKDVVTRWAHQSGFHVERRFGWDCHGLPIEYEIDKALKIDGPDAVLKMGVDKYNAECRKIVMRYSAEWRQVVGRFGRWIDFDNDYKTMYPWFMESVWWVFKQLFNKGLVYRGVKVMPFSTACSTPLSNFESGQNYKDVLDPAIIVSFPLDKDPSVAFLAWTTTPWTLPSNLALCVHPELEYVKVKENSTGRVFIMMKARLQALFHEESEYAILEEFPGKKLEGTSYQPLFPYFKKLKKERGAFRVLCDTYVTTDTGTGLVHQAPYFGEDDYRVCLKNGVVTKEMAPICPVDASGRFTAEVTDFAGQHVKTADKDICRMLKQNQRLIHQSQVKHSYPFCWRSETPLIYRAVPSWFVRVENFTDRLLKSNDATYWVPEFVKEGRFANWLRDARDWAISRNRFWGTPIPIWVSDDGEEVVCVGSIKELQELTGCPEITDLHKDFVDKLTIPSTRGKGQLKRISEVFDCWFESGSMPYAQQHFPFENSREFLECFPADFIAEGIDQTRGWFYTLLVLSTLLFDKPPFKNLVVNGTVLAEDGKKMSKRLKNYPDPIDVVNKFGADAVRLYLVNSPAVRAEMLRFKESGVNAVVRDVFIPWYNAFRFLLQNVERAEAESGTRFTFTLDCQKSPSDNYMDRWILSYTQSLVKFVHTEMAAYHLYAVMPQLVRFIEQLTNWYVRMNRRRLKGETGEVDCACALQTLFTVVQTTCRLLAPFLPFLTEYMYQKLKTRLAEDPKASKIDGVDTMASVHFLMLPQPVLGLIELPIETAIQRMQTVVELGRVIRDRTKLPLKTPLSMAVVAAKDPAEVNDIMSMSKYITEELNVRDLLATTDRHAYGIKLKVLPDLKKLGSRLKGKMKAVQEQLTKLSEEEANALQSSGSVTLCDEVISVDEVLFTYSVEASTTSKDKHTAKFEAHSDGHFFVLLDVNPDESLQTEGLAREFASRVQRLRKSAHLQPSDDVTVYYDVSKCGKAMSSMLSQFFDLIFSIIKQPMKPVPVPSFEKEIITETFDIKGDALTLTLAQRGSKWAESPASSGPAKAKRYAAVKAKHGRPMVPHAFVQQPSGKSGVVLLENPAGENAITSFSQFHDTVRRALGLILEPTKLFLVNDVSSFQQLDEGNFSSLKEQLSKGGNVVASFQPPGKTSLAMPDCFCVNFKLGAKLGTVVVPHDLSPGDSLRLLEQMTSTLFGLNGGVAFVVSAKPANKIVSDGLAGVVDFLTSSKEECTFELSLAK